MCFSRASFLDSVKQKPISSDTPTFDLSFYSLSYRDLSNHTVNAFSKPLMNGQKRLGKNGKKKITETIF